MRLWIDTNLARSVTAIEELCSLARSKGVEVVVHAQVYLERRRQQRVRLGDKFSETAFDRILPAQGIRVMDIRFDQATAAHWADALHRRYPTNNAWELAKKRTIGGELKADFRVEPGKMPMTTDWLIALAVESDTGSRVITRDDGEEWRVLRESEPKRALCWEEALAWLSGLPPRDPPLAGGV